MSGDYKILLTCHNRVLANDLRKRVKHFFEITRTYKQIDPEKLMIVHAWGERRKENSGAYRYITHFYNLEFLTYGQIKDFNEACKKAKEKIEKIQEEKKEKFKYAFDYVLIDESQDLPDAFFELCKLVTKEKVYIAGDIFQSIFKRPEQEEIKADLILNKSYRTNQKTLMFGHSIAIGLLENEKIWILEEEGWKNLGYKIEKTEDKKIKLTREPIKRFDDIDEESVEKRYEGIPVNIIKVSNDTRELFNNIVKEINRYKSIFKDYDNSQLEADDIAIIFIDEDPKIYTYMEILEGIIKTEFSWDTNNAVYSKERKKRTKELIEKILDKIECVRVIDIRGRTAILVKKC